jgi:hypothetical protein
VGANGHVETAAGAAVVGDHGVTDPMVPEGVGGAVAAGAATDRDDWLFNIVPKSVAEAGLRGFTGRSDLRRITRAVYVGNAAALNVGMKWCM